MPQRLKPDSTSESNDLRNAGLKVTLPRLKILDILADGSARHMSAEDIYKKLLVSNEDIGLATVYRVLTQFEAPGVRDQRSRFDPLRALPQAQLPQSKAPPRQVAETPPVRSGHATGPQ